jgi:hypothetical protein
VLVWLKEREPRQQAIRQRLAQRAAASPIAGAPDLVPAVAGGASGTAEARPPAGADGPVTPRRPPTGAIPPRPRKKKRR